MHVDTRTLELLEAIATDGTLTAASERLHVSQPALSQRLTGLERRLGIALFARQGKRLVPTRAGLRIIHTATSVLTELRAAERDLDDIRHDRTAVLRLTSQCSTNYQWLPPVVQALATRCPDVQVRIETVAHDDVIGALLDDRVDVALACKPDKRMDAVATLPLFDDEMVAVVPIDHPWATRPHLRRGDLDGTHLILFDAYDPTRVPPLPLPLPDGGRPARITTTPTVSELVVELVAAGQGIGILPGWVASPYTATGRVATVRLSRTPQTRTWYATWRQEDQPAHIVTLVDILRDHFADRPLPAAV
jgi:LysR family transcriptional regulator for metE and metH